MKAELKTLAPVFISAVAGTGITQLKDLIWNELQSTD
jgi:hypothetical protein